MNTAETARQVDAEIDEGTLDPERYRADFPTLQQEVNGHPLVYLDNAATTQKPQVVIDALRQYYETDNANIHRGVHSLSVRATQAYERARETVRTCINAPTSKECIFVRGATEGMNLVAQTLARGRLQRGDEILVSGLEHHSNIVPWQLVGEQIGTRLRVIPLDDAGSLRLDTLDELLTSRTKVLALAHVSNALGTINPVDELVRRARANGTLVLVDGAQAVPHAPVDVQALDCDFYVFSGHKVFGPTGIGVVYGKAELLDELPPYQGGGEMIASVTFEKTTYAAVPHKFEAGTPHIAGAIGLGAALEYVSGIGMEQIAAYESELLRYATDRLTEISALRLIGTADRKASVLSFVIDGVHPHDLGTILDQFGIAVRAGHHCAQPVMEHFGVPATCRASLAFYNTRSEIDTLVDGIQKAIEVFR